MEQISLYSETFGKRVTKWYDISTVENILNTSTDKTLYENVISCLLSVSGYEKSYKEYITYIIK